MRLASLIVPSLLLSACGPGESVPSSLPSDPTGTASSAVTLVRTYDCFRMVYADAGTFSMQHIVNVMSDGSVISSCALNGALQGSGNSTYQSTQPEAATGKCFVAAYANGTPTGESWTLELIPTLTHSLGTYHLQNSPQDGLVYALACSVR